MIKRILILSPYPEGVAAGQRLKYEQYYSSWESAGFHLEKSGRYTHSKSYIDELCKEFRFSISHFSETNLRKEKGSFLIGGLYFLDF